MRSLVLVLCGLALAAPSVAQEGAEEPVPESAESAPEGAAEEQPDTGTRQSPDRFTPSEEISLDLPVSFPVDI
ncbi:MAG TPA: hypothetical protein VM616_11080 [Gammaproteobacteria bacterium]|nr:hypothetical protein [Gammaproteobacteria bacterium]